MQGREKEQEDQELLQPFDPQLRDEFSVSCSLHVCDREAGVRWNGEDKLSGKTY